MAKKNYVKVLTPEFAISYPVLITPKVGMNAQAGEQFSCKMLFPKNMDAAQLAIFNNLKAKVKEVAIEAFGNPLPKNLHNPVGDGDEKEDASAFNHWFMNAKTKYKPGIVDAKLRDLSDEEIAERLYPGAICRATVLLGAFDVPGKRGVNVTLQNIQVLRDGTRLVAKRDAKDDFEATETSESASDFSDNSGF